MRGLFRTLEGNSEVGNYDAEHTCNRNPYALAAKSFAMRSRSAASGTGPKPACRLSCMCSAREVAGITHVTAGCETMNFRNSCAQLVQPMSLA